MAENLNNICVACGHKLANFENICPICGTKRQIQCKKCFAPMDYDQGICYVCGTKVGFPFMTRVFWVILFVVLALLQFSDSIIDFAFEQRWQNKNTTSSEVLKPKNNIAKNKNLYYEIVKRDGGEEIKLEEMMDFSKLSPDIILDLRKHMIESSPVFEKLTNYTPSSDVFDIEDNIPWIGAYQAACVGTEGPNYAIGEGPSRESLTILNPELLLHPLVPSVFEQDRPKCDESVFYIPKKVIYFKDINTITTYLDISSIKQKIGYIIYPYYLVTANARDLGYNSIFASEYINVEFVNQYDNMSLNISNPRGFWHRGYACGLPEGCNNYSPRDSRFELKTPNLPAAIRIKLWKNTPRNKNAKADLTYEIVFE